MNPELTEEVIAAIERGLLAGATRKAAAEAAGITVQRLNRWLELGALEEQGIYRDLYEAVITAESHVELQMAKYLTNAAKVDWRAALEWLRRRRPDDWVERKEVVGKDGGKIEISVELASKISETVQELRGAKSPEELARLYSEAIRSSGESGERK